MPAKARRRSRHWRLRGKSSCGRRIVRGCAVSIYRRPADGIEDYGVSAAGRVLEHGPAPLAFVGWLIRFPYFGGALQRIVGLITFLWRRYAPP